MFSEQRCTSAIYFFSASEKLPIDNTFNITGRRVYYTGDATTSTTVLMNSPLLPSHEDVKLMNHDHTGLC